MKMAEIDYTQNGEDVTIVGFRNVASIEQIKKEFGGNVLRLYLQRFPYFHEAISPKGQKGIVLCVEPIPQYLAVIRLTDETVLFPNDILSLKSFERICSSLKLSGARLKRIVQETKSQGIKTVKI